MGSNSHVYNFSIGVDTLTAAYIPTLSSMSLSPASPSVASPSLDPRPHQSDQYASLCAGSDTEGGGEEGGEGGGPDPGAGPDLGNDRALNADMMTSVSVSLGSGDTATTKTSAIPRQSGVIHSRQTPFCAPIVVVVANGSDSGIVDLNRADGIDVDVAMTNIDPDPDPDVLVAAPVAGAAESRSNSHEQHSRMQTAEHEPCTGT
ncbi:hypothetical protein BGZ54_004158, partial [Gamsiella multidivaricata]